MSFELREGAHVLTVYGTRPEAIKLAPVIAELRSRSDRFRTDVCNTGQHREMTAQVEDLLGFEPDLVLDLMEPDQTLNGLISRSISALETVLERAAPDAVVVQGDTSTAMAASLAAFNRGIPVCHVEAGLRTGDMARPFPEEANRRIIDLLAMAKFAPTRTAFDQLVSEGSSNDTTFLTGNTVVDALLDLAGRMGPVEREDTVLVTMHRRESFGPSLAAMLEAVRRLAVEHPSTSFVLPVHPNPNVSGHVRGALSDMSNIELVEPMDYFELIRLLRTSRLVMTDSGGIQEEAPTFGVPVLVLRDRTERPEGVQAGVARLVGVSTGPIVAAAREVLDEAPPSGPSIVGAANPYGDGHAASRIASILAGEDWSPWDGEPARAVEQ